MERIVLKAKERKISGKGALNELRNNDKLPCILYGQEIKSQPIIVDGKEFRKILRDHGETALITIEINGNSHVTLIKEIQRDTLKNSIMHVDFYKVSMTEAVEFLIPITLIGESIGVKEEDGILQQQKREITAKALPTDMIQNIDVDISDLKIGDTITVADIEVDDKIEILDAPEEVIISIVAPKYEEEEEEETEEEEILEPELIEKGKEEEGEEETEEE